MALLANEKSEDLIRMFALFSRVENGLNPMANMVEQFIVSMGNEVIKQRQARIEGGDKDKNDDPDFIKALLELHENYLALVRSDFSGHALFQKALKDAFVLWKLSTRVQDRVPMQNSCPPIVIACSRAVKN
jgi:cullin 1